MLLHLLPSSLSLLGILTSSSPDSVYFSQGGLSIPALKTTNQEKNYQSDWPVLLLRTFQPFSGPGGGDCLSPAFSNLSSSSLLQPHWLPVCFQDTLSSPCPFSYSMSVPFPRELLCDGLRICFLSLTFHFKIVVIATIC